MLRRMDKRAPSLRSPIARCLPAIAVAVVGLAPACVNEVDDGADGFEPIDLRDNVELQGLVDCTERGDTGYTHGSSFAIDVVTVDGRPVEVATANAYVAMQRAAADDGISLRIVSGFRTMAEQQHLYSCYVNCSCNSCNLAARPGYSNHQSGHALDLNASDSGVSSWLSHNASRFGFSRTVPSESWHYEWWGNAADFAGPCGVAVDNGGDVAADTCAPLDAGGGTIDDGDNCFEPGGPSQYLRAVNVGNDGDLLWTGTTNHASAVSFAVWHLDLAEAGQYRVEAFVQGSVATSTQTKYVVAHAGSTSSVVVDQTGADRWVDLGTFDFDAGGAQRVRVDDNTGEAGSSHKKIVFDAVRLTRIDGQSVDPSPPPADPCPYVEVTTNGGSLNVRRDPNTQQAAVGSLDDGVTVRALATVSGQSVGGNTDWHRIQTASLTGYISGAFATCRDAP